MANLAEKYRHCLNQLTNHPFVTSESEQRRIYLHGLQNRLDNVIASTVDCPVTTVRLLPFGSVAPGLAEGNSDIDMYILYSSIFGGGDSLSSLLYSRPLIMNTMDLFSSENGSAFSTTERFFWERGDVLNYFYTKFVYNDMEFSSISSFFAPSIKEIQGEADEYVSELRKDLLQILKAQDEKTARKAWYGINEAIKQQRVFYETSGNQDPKRKSRVDAAIKSVLLARFSESEKKVERATRLITAWRQNWSLPKLEEMYQAFGI